MKRTQAGITLVEVLVVAVMGALITLGTVRAFVAGVDFETRLRPQRQELSDRLQFENRMRGILTHAYLDPDAEDTSTYFLLESSGGGTSIPGGSDLPDQITLTTNGDSVSGGVLASSDDFETRNDRFGPQGGIAEIRLSTSPYNAPGDETGLFIREQRPSDTDYTQGGFESLLWDRITSLGFEVYDGTQWTTIWDTTQSDDPRLPAAIRVTYTLSNTEDESFRFVVRLPLSDVTPDDPGESGSGDLRGGVTP